MFTVEMCRDKCSSEQKENTFLYRQNILRKCFLSPAGGVQTHFKNMHKLNKKVQNNWMIHECVYLVTSSKYRRCVKTSPLAKVE